MGITLVTIYNKDKLENQYNKLYPSLYTKVIKYDFLFNKNFLPNLFNFNNIYLNIISQNLKMIFNFT